MKAKLFACLTLLTALAARAESPEETLFLQMTDEVDTAIAAGDQGKLRSMLHPKYLYAEPESARPLSDDVPLPERIDYRLARDKCWSDGPLSVRVVGDTAIVTGTYRVLEPYGQPRLLAKGRFTATWVKADGFWRMLAEHRSLNVDLTWATAEAPPTRKPPAVTVASSRPTGAGTTPADQGQNAHPVGNDEETRVHRGLLPKVFTNLFRAYEPNLIGYTRDKGDDAYLDFTFSAMFPLLPGQTYPGPVRTHIETDLFRPLGYGKPNLYFAATQRAGQYIGTRPSSPVFGKRFNPLVALRFWAENAHHGTESEDNFAEVVYGHESNGQFIASKGRFDEQFQVYLNQDKDATTPEAVDIARRTAFRSTRDNISRGWDYVGVQFARDWDSSLPWSGNREVTMGLHARFNYYLDRGLAQGDAEEYNTWEADPEGKPRKRVDGISLRYTLTIAPDHHPAEKPAWYKLFKFERRYALTWTTGYVEPFRFNTLKAEASLTLFDKLPLTLWYRRGYNSDLIDYYRKDHSLGLSLSYWNF
jgi:hypothetical protein